MVTEREQVETNDRGIATRADDYPILLILALYALVAVMFSAIYFRMTAPWSAEILKGYTTGGDLQPGLLPIFRLRVLMPYLASGVQAVTHADFHLIYRGLAAVSVFGALLAYRRYLTCFMRPVAAGLMAMGIIYPLLWNLCLLNNLYFPFDLPSILFFIIGLDAIYRRNLPAFYAALFLGMLNRETAAFLILVFVFSMYGRMPLRRLLAHVVAQVVIAAGLKLGISAALNVKVEWFEGSHLAHNAGVLRDMFTLQGNALKDWGKALLVFGGLWLVLPLVWKGQPGSLRRVVLIVVPFIAAMLLRAVVDEIRDYTELIPVILTPVAYWMSLKLRESLGQGASPPPEG
jgi:hypothetical protein